MHVFIRSKCDVNVENIVQVALTDLEGAGGGQERTPLGPISFITAAMKLGQGYVFTRVCDSVHGGGGASVHAGKPPGGRPPQEETRKTPLGAVHAKRYGQQAGSTHPTGMHTCFHAVFGKNVAK